MFTGTFTIRLILMLNADYFETWKSILDIDIQKEFAAIEQMKPEPHSFTFYTSVSVMSSSKIEGEQLEVDSYVKHKILELEYLPELSQKPNDLYNAYLFAKENRLSLQNFQRTHKLIATHLLPEVQRGVLRKTEMLVMEHQTGRIQYEAAMVRHLQKEYEKLWREIELLLKKELSKEEVFYFALISTWYL